MNILESVGAAATDIVRWVAGTDRVLGGVLGGVVAMMLVRDTWPRRFALLLGAGPAAYYGGALFVQWLGWPEGEGVYGFACGLFALRLFRIIFNVLDRPEVETKVASALHRLLGAIPGGGRKK